MGSSFLAPFSATCMASSNTGEQRRTALLADLGGVTQVIVVTVRERDMRHAGRRLIPGDPRRLEGRVALEEGIDEHDALAGLDAKAGMAEPCDLHSRR